MLVKWIWHQFMLCLHEKNWRYSYVFSDVELVLLLIIIIIMTPILLLLDIIILPLEVLFWLLLKFVRKLRRG